MQKLSFMLFFFLNHIRFLLGTSFVVVTDVRPSLWLAKLVSESLCVKLLGGGFLISRSGGLPLSQIVAAFVLLSHAVHQEEDEEDGKEEANNSARDDGWNRGFGQC